MADSLISIVPMVSGHAKEMADLELACFTLPWTQAMIEQELSHDYAHYWAALRGAELVGYAGLNAILDEGYITNVAVRASFRRHHIGTLLLNTLIKQAGSLSLSFLTLEVRVSNMPAIALYKRFGFVPCGTRKNYYEQPAEDALLMTRRLP